MSSRAGPTPATPKEPAVQPRLKIEYRPLARPLNTHGGRNIQMLEQQRELAQNRRSLRSLDEWGEINMEGIIMSIRSRVPVELSYALTTLTVLSVTINSPQGLPLQYCEDLVGVLLNLLEEAAFDEPEKPEINRSGLETKSSRLWTQRDLIKEAVDNASVLFSGKADRRDRRVEDSDRGPTPRDSDLVLSVLNLFRNLSMTSDNQVILGREPRFIDVIMRIVGLQEESTSSEGGGSPKRSGKCVPASPVLTLTDLVKARDHVLQIISNISTHEAPANQPTQDTSIIKFSSLMPQTPGRIFRLLASYLASSDVAVTPFSAVRQELRGATNAPPTPPAVPDLVLDTLARVAQLDENRYILSHSISSEDVFKLFQSLVHMLPVSNEDYKVITLAQPSLEPWVGYVERIILCIYSLAFMSPPPMKKRMKKYPGFIQVLMRVVRFYMKGMTTEGRSFLGGATSLEGNGYAVCGRRAMETLRLLDEETDSFADGTSAEDGEDKNALGFGGHPTFGVGYGEPEAMGSARNEEGVGLLAGEWEDMFTKMMCREGMDNVFFSEMDSLVRMGNAYDLSFAA
ncbi:hypothetical protein FRC02_002659 [Tulasnella sp. 418]|nr:hypothetical protein FRC02_002659 [Tulasnella sp. 418]